jgi:YegS/Rv2252/BmrU family lipid kinase
MSFAIIINPVSGGARLDAARTRMELAAAIRDAHGQAGEVLVTARHGHARELARAARERGASVVFAWGGDGTINEVASELAFGNVPLGIVPAGSGNGLALELGVAPNPAIAIPHALAATPRPIDVGELGGRLFVNIAGIGFDAHVASRFNQATNVRRGFAGYISISGRALFSYKPARYTIKTGGAQVDVERGILLTIANSPQFGNGARIAPGARVDDGLLDLVIVDEQSRPRTVCGLPRLFNGTLERMKGCSIRRITEATIACDQPMTFHVDGEPVENGRELHARVHPRALLIAV